jgi:hypothetical protein
MLQQRRKYVCTETFFWTASMLLMVACHSEADFSGAPKKSYDQVSSDVFSFQSSQIIDGSVTISDGGRYTSFEVKQTEKAPLQVIQRQIKRQAFSDSYVQGHSAKFSKEEFQLSEAGMIDFLLVIDDSASMDDEQSMVATGLSSLISEFKDTNWQIAVISMSDPCVSTSNLIKKTDANIDRKFSAAVKKPLDRRATEQGFPMSIQALKGQCNGALRPWLRDGSSVGILIVSDEDNCGSNPGEQDRCKNIVGKNPSEMVAFMRSIRAQADAKIYALVDHDGTCKDAGGTGLMYVDAVNQTGGSIGSICNDYTTAGGYSEFLKSVSKDVSRIIKRQFTLSAVPDMAQFNVAVDGVDLGTNGVLSIKGNIVTIDPAHFQSGMKITFSYTHDAVPMFAEVPVVTQPDLDSLKITVNGTGLSFGVDYTYDDPRRVIKFSVMPPEDSKISVNYMENKKLNTHFAVDLSGVRPDTLRVSVNGVLQDAAVFAYDQNGIDFSIPPVDGAIISTLWKTDGQKNLSYPASISDPRRPVAWVAKDTTAGIDVPAQWDGKIIKFTADNVIDGRVITVTVDFGEKSAVRIVDLPDERIDSDLMIFADNQPGICEETLKSAQSDVNELPLPAPQNGEKMDLDDRPDDPGPSPGGDSGKIEDKKPDDWKKRYKGKQVVLQCKAGVDYQSLIVKYKHEVSRTTEFSVPLPKHLDAMDKNIAWKVYIDGRPTKDFRRDGATVHIDSDLLPPATRVDIEVKVFEPVVN